MTKREKELEALLRNLLMNFQRNYDEITLPLSCANSLLEQIVEIENYLGEKVQS